MRSVPASPPPAPAHAPPARAPVSNRLDGDAVLDPSTPWSGSSAGSSRRRPGGSSASSTGPTASARTAR
jgi:hypothetical protein